MADVSLIPELEEVVQNGSPERRAETLQRITDLFLNGADQLNEDHIRLFDDVLGTLVAEIESKARAELSRRLAPVENAPPDVVRTLARDDDIAVAGPVLKQSPRLGDDDLVDIARTKSQDHLMAIAGRRAIDETVTDVLVERGSRDVVHNVAENRGARFSDDGFTALVKRSEQDDDLAEKVGLRADIPPRLFRDLLIRATDMVQRRLLASARPELQAEIRKVLTLVSEEVGAKVRRDYSAARRLVEEMRRAGKLNETALNEFASSRRFEETVAALALLCAVPIDVVERLMGGERPDPVLILCKASGWSWNTARAIMAVRPGVKPASSYGLDAAFSNFERLSPATAQRVLRFWQVRSSHAA